MRRSATWWLVALLACDARGSVPPGDHSGGTCPDGSRPAATPEVYATAGRVPPLTPAWVDPPTPAPAPDPDQALLLVRSGRHTLRGEHQDGSDAPQLVVEHQHRDAPQPGWTRAWPNASTSSGVLLPDGTAVLALGFYDQPSEIVAIEPDGTERWAYPLDAMAWLSVLDDGSIAIGLVPEVPRQWQAGHPDAPPPVEFQGGAVVGVLEPGDGRPRWFAAVGEHTGAWEVRGASTDDGGVVFSMHLHPGDWDPHCSLPTWPFSVRAG